MKKRSPSPVQIRRGHTPRPKDQLVALIGTEVVRFQEDSAAFDLAESPWALPPRMLPNMMQWERAFVAAGGLLGAGSDPWGTGLIPGVGNLRNYELLVEAGFPSEQAIQIMTLNGARILGIDQRFGSIAPGKIADLVVIQGDPVRRPADIYNVVTVFRDGVGYDSARLRQAAAGRVGAS